MKKISARLSDEHEKMFINLCNKTRFNTSELIRFFIVYHTYYDKLKINKDDLREFLKQLRAIGRNINQIAKALNITIKNDHDFFSEMNDNLYKLNTILSKFIK